MAAGITYDLVVVGCGGAGLSAAVGYADASWTDGRDVRIAVLERARESDRGGSTGWSEASMLVDEEFALDAGFVRSMATISNGLADLDLCAAFVEAVPDTGRFLRDHGVEFASVVREREGERHVHHLPIGGGRSIIDRLAGALEGHPGATILYETEGIRLSVSAGGRVDGVVVRGPDGLLRTIHATSVVLACGGFEGNPEMLTKYVGKNVVDLRHLAPSIRHNRGEGIRMAKEIGAATSGQFDAIQAVLVDARTNRPDSVLYGHTWPIVVNADAKRFFDEGATMYGDSFELIAREVWANQDQTAFFITDDLIVSDGALTALWHTDLAPVEADTIGELATKLGIDPGALEATVDEFNAACSSDRPFNPLWLDGKSTSGIEPPKSNWANPINHPPYYGYPVSTAIVFTFGGLKTDASARVLSTGGVPIPGLYAAGELAGLYYHKYIGATLVLKACTFGRVAGTHAASTGS